MNKVIVNPLMNAAYLDGADAADRGEAREIPEYWEVEQGGWFNDSWFAGYDGEEE